MTPDHHPTAVLVADFVRGHVFQVVVVGGEFSHVSLCAQQACITALLG